jgi:hypothetical protein
VAQVEARAADHVRHERVARHELALLERERHRVEVGFVAGARLALWQLVLDRRTEPPARLERAGIELLGQPPPSREPAQQLEQPEVRPRKRLALVHDGLHDGDRAAVERCPQDGFELAERRLTLGDAAEVVLVEVEERWRLPGGYASLDLLRGEE